MKTRARFSDFVRHDTIKNSNLAPLRLSLPKSAVGHQARHPPPRSAPAPSPLLPVFNSAFGEFAELAPFLTDNRRTNAPPALPGLAATGTGGAFTFSRPLHFRQGRIVPTFYHVLNITLTLHSCLENDLDVCTAVNELYQPIQR